MTIQELEKLVKYYYDLGAAGKKIINTISYEEGNVKSQVYYAVLNGFFSSLENYLLLVYDDLKADVALLFAKSNTNKVLLRIAIEATLLLDIFENNPDLIDAYYATYVSDKKRMNALFKGEEYNEKYLRRFEWLPKIKKKRPSSLVDLLDYVKWEDEEQKEYYKIIIRNLDTFIHPSFYVGRSVETRAITNIDTIAPIFAKEGIISELYENLIDLSANYSQELASELAKLLNSDTPSNDIDIAYQKSHEGLPASIGPICFFLSNIGHMMHSPNEPTYLQRNIAYLTTDLTPRYEDLLQSYFMGNKFLFEIQLRTILESLSMMHILLKEDEYRNYVFFIHQQIKSFEANKSALELLEKHGITVQNLNLDDDRQRNIDIIKDYYKRFFNADPSQKDILRLNGWALYLRGVNNDTVPNAVDIINNMLNDFFKEEPSSLLSNIFEESNTYMHVTLYAFLDDKAKINHQFVTYINHSLLNILNGILNIPNLLTISNKEKEDLLRNTLLTFTDLNSQALHKV